MEGHVTLSRKEIHRCFVLQQVVDGRMSLKDAATTLNISYRNAKRLKKKFAAQGAAGLSHGNRGKPSLKKVANDVQKMVISLANGRYKDFNDVHFTEMLGEREGIVLSREVVRQILRSAGIKPKRKRRPPKFRSRRPRKEAPGMLVQWDGSPHRWFGEDHPACCLMAAVDDADGALLAAFFAPAESSEAYLRLLAQILETHGIPAAVYHDRHSSLVRTDDNWSFEEQLRGAQYPTHVGRVLEELGIESIPASSPQAKGRVERRFGVLQDRLIAEMRLDGICSIDEANRWLKGHFIARYNKRFAIASNEPPAYVPISKEEIFTRVCFAYECTVGRDNAVRIGGLIIDLPNEGISYANKRVIVRQHLDGSWSVWYGSKQITTHATTPLREPVRAWRKRRGNNAKDLFQVYIASKPAHPQKGAISFCR